jgi:hypothetical protein
MTSNQSDPESGADQAAVTPARRRFLQGALAAGPIIVTLHSKPVLGGVCQSPSRRMSGSMSQRTAQIDTCSGRPCSYYRSTGAPGGTAAGWTQLRPERIFNDVLRGGQMPTSWQLTTVGTVSQRSTMYQVLCATPDKDPHGLCGHFVTALLNINAGRVPPSVLDQAKLFGMWTDWRRSGFYQPSATSPAWNAAAIVRYFNATGIAPS